MKKQYITPKSRAFFVSCSNIMGGSVPKDGNVDSNEQWSRGQNYPTLIDESDFDEDNEW